MALKGNWVDKQDGIDDVLAEDINQIAEGVIDLEDALSGYTDGSLTFNSIVARNMTVTGVANFEDGMNVPFPTSASNPASKAYVDDAISTAINNLPIYNGEVETE